jgi:heme/copper-type cytochrome/quinol oxidase subunit 2
MLLTVNSDLNIFAIHPNQMTFQYPATYTMYNIIELHHDIMFILIFISIFVIYMLWCILTNFNVYNFKKPRTNLYDMDKVSQIKMKIKQSNITHNSLLEIV